MPRSWRLRLVDFLVRMWRLNACERLIEPLPRTRKRFFAPVLVFIFGMTAVSFYLLPTAVLSRALSRRERLRRPCPLTGLGLGCGMLRATALPARRLLRRQHHHHLPAFQPRKLLDHAVRLEIVPHALQQPHAEFLVRHLAPAEAQRDLRLVAFLEEADQVAQLDLVVAFVGAGPELDFLDLDLLQLELRLVLLLRSRGT